MKKCIYLIGLVLGGLFTSCGSADLLTYDQLVPAEISFPSDIRQIGVVNNMPLRKAASQEDVPLAVVSAEGVYATEALAGELADSKYFDQVIICDSALQTEEVDLNIDPKLSESEIQTLTRDLGVDLLVSLERLWVQIAKKEVYYPGWEIPVPVIQSIITPVVRLYVSGRPQPMNTITFTDSLFWDLGTPVTEEMIVKESSKLAARKISSRLVPSWIPAERIYFSGGGGEMRDAAILMQEGSWQEAQNTWKGLYDRLRKGKTKSKAAYNIALSYEMLGNIEEASQWVTKALSQVPSGSQEEHIMKLYAEELNRRLTEVVNLKVQMHRFNDNF